MREGNVVQARLSASSKACRVVLVAVSSSHPRSLPSFLPPTAFPTAPAALLAATFAFCAPSLASADVGSTGTTKDGYAYKFLDDLVDSNVMGPKGDRIKVRPGAVRSLLIRPRASFIVEMFKSVEDI